MGAAAGAGSAPLARLTRPAPIRGSSRAATPRGRKSPPILVCMTSPFPRAGWGGIDVGHRRAADGKHRRRRSVTSALGTASVLRPDLVRPDPTPAGGLMRQVVQRRPRDAQPGPATVQVGSGDAQDERVQPIDGPITVCAVSPRTRPARPGILRPAPGYGRPMPPAGTRRSPRSVRAAAGRQVPFGAGSTLPQPSGRRSPAGGARTTLGSWERRPQVQVGMGFRTNARRR